jgi:predicted ester cyclase
MSIAENEKIAHLWFEEVWSSPEPGNTLEEIIHPDYRPDKSMPAKKGARMLSEEIKQARTAFPDMKFEILEMAALEDRVWVRHRSTGTHKGTFLGFPATGEKTESEGVTILYIRDHKVIDQWTTAPLYDMLVQLGVVPPLFALKDYLRWPR